MSNSPLGGRVQFRASDIDGDDPVDEVLMRDGIVNTMLHLGDECGRCLFNFSALDNAVSQAAQVWRHATPSDTTHWFRVLPAGPMSLMVKGTQAPFRLRIRLGGASSAGHSVQFAVAIGATPSELLSVATEGLAGQVKTWAAITSTTPAFYTAQDGTDYLDLPAPALNLWQAPTLDDLSGTETTVPVWRVWIDVYGKTANTASKPQLWALHISEYGAA